VGKDLSSLILKYLLKTATTAVAAADDAIFKSEKFHNLFIHPQKKSRQAI
jgi:hypothetical protein